MVEHMIIKSENLTNASLERVDRLTVQEYESLVLYVALP